MSYAALLPEPQNVPERKHTKAGPGRMPFSRNQHNPAGTKRIRRFIRDARGEASAYRKDLLALTGITHA